MLVGLLLEIVGTDEPLEVLVDMISSAPTSELSAAIAGYVGLPAAPQPACIVLRTGTAFDELDTVGELQLRHGDCIRVGRAKRARNAADASPFDLLVVGGPSTGSRYPLVVGDHVLGRDSRADVPLRDEEASRRHARLTVTGQSVTIEDLGSTNGTFIDGRNITGPEPLTGDQVVEIGDTLLSVESTTPSTPGAHVYENGRLLFNRPPRVANPYDPPSFRLPIAPKRAEKTRVPLAASIVPILMGTVMFALLHNPTFLLFMALGPVMAVFSVVDSRRSGRSAYRKDARQFDQDLGVMRESLATAHDANVRARRAAQPSLPVLTQRASDASAELWERRASDVDFLSLRVGTADQPTELDVEVPDGGDTALAARAADLRSEFAIDPLVPVTVDLDAGHVLGITGDPQASEALARALIVQVCCLHSPRDVVVAVFAAPQLAHRWSWAHWLPHATSGLGAEDGAAVATSDADARAWFERLGRLVEGRTNATRVGAAPPPRPHVLVVVAGDIAVETGELSHLLAEAAAGGMSALVLKPTSADLPGECDQIVNVGSSPGSTRLTVTATGVDVSPIVADLANVGLAAETARSLAGVRDAGAASRSSSLPETVALLDLVKLEPPTPGRILERWAATRGLVATLGVGRNGPVTIDLRRDGPHTLVAGTTGAGKSELLQTLVGSLAATCPPDRLGFVLVDYKGGAAFKDCAKLPHTVGFFTDLDAHLAQRALVSLNTELRRREEILRAASAKDLVELEAHDPALAPPSLVIVFDEFAFLKREVPEFVDGVVDIAQRGRSLGIHLVLATQRPSGVVDDHIRANTNLRIALRVNDDHESNDVIGRNDAARLSRAIPGRALVRTGHGEVQEIQTAFAGHVAAPASHDDAAISVQPFPPSQRLHPRRIDGGPVTDVSRPTDLERLVETLQVAAEQAQYVRQPSPWLEPLRAHYSLADLSAGEEGVAGLRAVLGVLDEPDHQRQPTFELDLADAGHLLVYGAAGTGKTTALRTLAASLARRYGPAELHLYALDCASLGLRSIETLPQCAGVVAVGDGELVEQLIAHIDEEISRRRALLGRVGGGSLAELRGRGTDDLPPDVVLLLDDWGGLTAAFETVDRGELIDTIERQVADGRALGIHFVITAARRSGLPAALTAQISRALVLRLADEDEYAWLGLGRDAADAQLGPGRGFTDAGSEIQIAVAGPDNDGGGQARAIAALAQALRSKWEPVPRLVAPPDDIERDALPRPVLGATRIAFALDALSGAPVYVEPADQPVFLVAGPDRSGRSTALSTLARAFVATTPEAEAALVAPRRTSLLDALAWTETARAAEADELLGRLLRRLEERADAAGYPLLVVIDDADELTDGPAAASLERLVRRARDGGVVLFVACQTHTLHRSFGGFGSELRKAKHGVVLQPDADVDGDLFGVRLPRKSTRRFPPGRGYAVSRGVVTYAQVAR